MKNRRGTKRKRIIIYYVIAIVFPCIILGMLAYRGIKNDQALTEKEQLRTFQESGQKVSAELEGDLKIIENNFIKLIDSTEEPDGIIFSDSALRTFVSVFPAVEGVFYLSAKNEVSLLNKCLLYRPENVTESKTVELSDQAKGIRENAWKLEFRQKDYSKAIDLYRKALRTSPGMQDQAEFYNSIARLQKKLGNPRAAMETYKGLFNNYSDVYIQGNIPLGMVALLESGLLYLKIQDTLLCLEALNVLLEQLIDSRWAINYSTFFNARSKIEETIALAENASGEVGSMLAASKYLMEDIAALEQKSAYLLSLTSETWSISSTRSSIADQSSNRYLFRISGNSYFVFLSLLEGQRQWGLLYNQEYFLQNMVNTSIRKIADESNFNWEIADNYGSILLQSDNVTGDVHSVKVMLSPSLPSWTLLIYPISGELLGSFFITNEAIYFYVFLLIVIILACGLFFTLYTVNNELRLTKMKSNFITTVSHEFKVPLP